MCTYAEEAWHQEAYSEKEGGKFAEAGPPPVGSGVDTGVAGQVSQAHHPLRAARRHPRGLCAVGLFFNLLQPSTISRKGFERLTKQSKEGSFHCDMTASFALERPLSEFLDSLGRGILRSSLAGSRISRAHGSGSDALPPTRRILVNTTCCGA